MLNIISIFFGIKITFNPSEHTPPHFHAEYNGHKITVNIIDGEVMVGYIPKKQLRLTLAWCEMYQDELIQNWELILAGKEPNQIQGLRK